MQPNCSTTVSLSISYYSTSTILSMFSSRCEEFFFLGFPFILICPLFKCSIISLTGVLLNVDLTAPSCMHYIYKLCYLELELFSYCMHSWCTGQGMNLQVRNYFIKLLLSFHLYSNSMHQTSISRLVCPAPLPTMQYLQPKIFVIFYSTNRVGQNCKVLNCCLLFFHFLFENFFCFWAFLLLFLLK